MSGRHSAPDSEAHDPDVLDAADLTTPGMDHPGLEHPVVEQPGLGHSIVEPSTVAPSAVAPSTVEHASVVSGLSSSGDAGIPPDGETGPVAVLGSATVAGALPSDTVVPASESAAAAAAAAAAAEGGRVARRRAAEEAARASALTSRRRAMIVSGSVLVLLVGLVVTWFVVGRSSSEPQPQQSVPATPTGPIQPTLLFQLKSEEGIAVGNSLLSVGGRSGRATDISIPPTVIVEVATGGALPFGEIIRLPDLNSSANALSDAMGVNVNATQWMDPLAFSGLVDAVGGIIADVDVDVLKTQPDGTKVVLIPAGKAQTLQGPQAALYASYLAPGEPEEARMARFTQVLRLVVSKLPSDPGKVEQILTGLGASARATVPAAQVAAFLVRLHSDVLSDNVAYKDLPVKADQVVSAVRIDQEATAAMVTQLLPDAVRTPGPNSKVRVLVQNGVGAPGLNAAARQALVDAGYTYVNGGNAASWGQKATAIVVPDATEESLRWGNEIATALKVPSTAVQVATSTQSVADVIVVLGADFKPTA